MSGPAILWVDDEPAFVEAHRPCLGDLAADCAWAPDGTQALARLREGAFDLVLTDLQMPPGEWGGLWLIQALAREELPPPVVVLSGRGTLSEAIEATRSGARDYVLKERAARELEAIARATLAQEADRLQMADYALVKELETGLQERVLGCADRLAAARGLASPFDGVLPPQVVRKALDVQGANPAKDLRECLFLIDYRTIVRALWDDAPEFRALAGLTGAGGKAAATAWIQELNDLRRTVMHPSAGALDRERRLRLRRIHRTCMPWLSGA